MIVVAVTGCGSVSTADRVPTTASPAGQTTVDYAPAGTYEVPTYEAPTYEAPAEPLPDDGFVPDDDNTDELWENRAGDSWDEFAQAFEAGWDEGCAAVFEQTPDGLGVLYYDDQGYTDSDCPSADDPASSSDVPALEPSDPVADGDSLGRAAGCQALFYTTGVPSLNWGEDSITEDACDGI